MGKSVEVRWIWYLIALLSLVHEEDLCRRHCRGRGVRRPDRKVHRDHLGQAGGRFGHGRQLSPNRWRRSPPQPHPEVGLSAFEHARWPFRRNGNTAAMNLSTTGRGSFWTGTLPDRRTTDPRSLPLADGQAYVVHQVWLYRRVQRDVVGPGYLA